MFQWLKHFIQEFQFFFLTVNFSFSLFFFILMIDFFSFFFSFLIFNNWSYNSSFFFSCSMIMKMLYFWFWKLVWNQIFNRSSIACQQLAFCERYIDSDLLIIVTSFNWLKNCHIKHSESYDISDRKSLMIKFFKNLIIQKKIWIEIWSIFY